MPNHFVAYDPISGQKIMVAAAELEARLVMAIAPLAKGQLVNEFETEAGELRVQLADAANQIPATGFVIEDVDAAGNMAKVLSLGEQNSHLTGLASGVGYVLHGTTPGAVQPVADFPMTAGSIRQYVGQALNGATLDTIQEEPLYV